MHEIRTKTEQQLLAGVFVFIGAVYVCHVANFGSNAYYKVLQSAIILESVAQLVSDTTIENKTIIFVCRLFPES